MRTEAELARAKYTYEPESGLLSWRVRTRGSGRALGEQAGTLDGTGYWYVSLASKRHPAHRVIWLIVTGHWPLGQIDHIDGDKQNNAWRNLRDVDAHTNAANKHRARVDSRSGYIGVYQQRSRWYAYINSRGKKFSLGGYPTPGEAAAARARAKATHHKEFRYDV